ncbi:hypothetical protein KY362_05880 [Candidatus Woesearchaeota archaeon]|nr:hypothetical protein [Candidatus Woesearchaeota archaeon]
MLDKKEAEEIVEEYMEKEKPERPVQMLLNEGAVPRLQGYVVKPGKVSHSIHGGKGSFVIDESKWEQYGDCVNPDDVEVEHFTIVERKKKNKEVPKNKVRVSYRNPELVNSDGVPLRFMVRTSAISTHDIVRGTIPFKAQILAQNHEFMRQMVLEDLGTSQFDVGLPPTNCVIASENLQQIAFENVLRSYMAKTDTNTSLYVHWEHAKERGEDHVEMCGHRFKVANLIPNGPLCGIYDTPSTKDDIHDLSVTPEHLFEHGLATPEQYAELRETSIKAYEKVATAMRQKGIILVDTKTEHGINHLGAIVGQDEYYTLDSSRWWKLDEYFDQMQLFIAGKIPEIIPTPYSKEFARGFSEGDAGYTDEQRLKIAVRYIMAAQYLMGAVALDTRPREERVIVGLEEVVKLAA